MCKHNVGAQVCYLYLYLRACARLCYTSVHVIGRLSYACVDRDTYASAGVRGQAFNHFLEIIAMAQRSESRRDACTLRT